MGFRVSRNLLGGEKGNDEGEKAGEKGGVVCAIAEKNVPGRLQHAKHHIRKGTGLGIKGHVEANENTEAIREEL